MRKQYKYTHTNHPHITSEQADELTQIKNKCERAFAGVEKDEAQNEMRMAIAFYFFLYHNYTVIICRADSADETTKLDGLKSARQAIRLLQEIAPDTTHIYNGVTW